MLDSYVWGKVDRISPEAPVPVLSVLRREFRPGGAANVALNVRALGATPLICSLTGNDEAGRTFLSLFGEAGISTEGLIQSDNRPTTIKTRIIGHQQQLMRIDEESTANSSPEETRRLLDRIEQLLREQAISVIIFEDYDKGVITPELIGQVTARALEKKIPVVVDPKKRNFLAYRNCTLFKPNLKELREGLKTELHTGDPGAIIRAAGALQEKLDAELVMVTLSEAGILIRGKDIETIIPAHRRNITDVSGAGDTVVSVAALGLAAGLPPSEFTAIANLAGGLVCEKVGVVPIDREQLLAEVRNFYKED
ncbi:D-glycero-beta-D-manno-heptose-7-phosphate kinase [Anseongella ginsenosidimutans]|nr:D-glycero-beta-D-manno-heptose-7-phosphate kinase [Anseongella ginsenosidimutans]